MAGAGEAGDYSAGACADEADDHNRIDHFTRRGRVGAFGVL
jgi:hypothetical protein